MELRIKQTHIAQRSNEEDRTVSNIKKLKILFQLLQKLSKTKSKVGPLRTKQVELTEDTHEICQFLMKQYISVFSTQREATTIKNPNGFFIENYSSSLPIKLSTLNIAKSYSRKAIKELPSNSVAGPNGAPEIFLLKCPEI